MQYRKEIDGLRAIAVFSVIFYHAGYSFFGGGYIGVDIFFVISGYLITSIILKDISNKSFKLIKFYERRIRRIIPALFFVVFVVTVFSLLWLLPDQLRSYAKSLASIPLFSSNFIFFLEGGYFDVSAKIKPLFHTWSLGIEEQFYLLYPFFLLAIWKKNKKILAFVFVLLVSLLISHWWSIVYPHAAYLLLPSRIWEFFIGGMVSIYGSSSFVKKTRNIQGVSQIMSVFGLWLIVYAVYNFNENTIFPGGSALIPVTGTALIILFATENTFVAKLISNKIFVGIGLISYSLYLWHQPIFSFFRILYNENPNDLEKIFLISLTMVLSYATWKYIEKPFRYGKLFSKKVIVLSIALPSLFFLTLGFYIYSTNGIGKLYSSSALIDLYQTKTILDTRCHANDRKSAEEIQLGEACKFGNEVIPSEFAILGDSHASTLFKYLDEIYSERGAFVGISNGNCPPLLNEFKLKDLSEKDCVEVNKASLEFISQQDSIKKVVLYAEWSNYTEGYRIDSKGGEVNYGLAESKHDKANNLGDNAFIFKKSLFKTVSFLKKSGKEVIIIKSSPEFKEKVMDAIARQIIDKTDDKLRTYPQISLQEYDKRNHKVEEIFSQIPGVDFLNSKNLFCSKNGCPSIDQNQNILFSDTNHLTYNGSKVIVDRLVHLLAYKDEK
jgi:peptidoglycan/LPS O-acetylase OafA/YrhL